MGAFCCGSLDGKSSVRGRKAGLGYPYVSLRIPSWQPVRITIALRWESDAVTGAVAYAHFIPVSTAMSVSVVPFSFHVYARN